MTFFEELQLATQAEQAALLSTPIIRKALVGDVTLKQYVAFLPRPITTSSTPRRC